MLDEIEAFLTGTRTTAEPDRVLATVLFTDIVGLDHARPPSWATAAGASCSTRTTRWCGAQLERYRGREVKTLGDGFLATFDGPARAIRCACDVRERRARARPRAARRAPHRRGRASAATTSAASRCNIGARVGARAGPGEVLVSQTVKDLVAGSGLDFEDRGAHDLKGVPGPWRLYAVGSASG